MAKRFHVAFGMHGCFMASLVESVSAILTMAAVGCFSVNVLTSTQATSTDLNLIQHGTLCC